MHGRFSWPLKAFGLFFKDLVDLIPESLGHNRFALHLAPFTLGFGLGFPVAVILEAVEIISPLGARVGQNAEQLAVSPEGVSTGAIAGDIEEVGNLAFAPMLQEQFIGLASDGDFSGMRNQFAVFPLVAVGSVAIDRLAKFRTGQDRSVDPFGNFLPFPLGEDPETAR